MSHWSSLNLRRADGDFSGERLGRWNVTSKCKVGRNQVLYALYQFNRRKLTQLKFKVNMYSLISLLPMCKIIMMVDQYYKSIFRNAEKALCFRRRDLVRNGQ